MIEFSPLFGTLKEYNDLQILVDFVIATNKLLNSLDQLFTMENFFGTSLVEFYESELLSDTYAQRYELLQLKINFEKVKF